MRRLIIGVGSPHGEDQIGWEIVDCLEQRSSQNDKCIKIAKPIDLLDVLEACDELIVIDAVLGLPVNVTKCWTWPVVELLDEIRSGSHGIGLIQVLQLADELHVLPKKVRIVGISIGDENESSSSTPQQGRITGPLIEEVQTLYA